MDVVAATVVAGVRDQVAWAVPRPLDRVVTVSVPAAGTG